VKTGHNNNNSNNKNKNKNKVSDSGKGYEDNDDEEIENWPPWVTAKPEGDKDIVIGQPDVHKDVKSTEKSGAGTHFTKAAIYYLVPVLTCLIGSLVP